MATEDKKKAVDLGLLEEDDEFEEFPVEEWDHKEEDQTDVNVWEDNWDDDTVEDDFSIQLSKFSRKRAMSRSPPLRSPDPVAKKVCSRLSPEVLLSVVNGGKTTTTTNGHACGDVSVSRSTRSSSRTRTTTPTPARGNRRSSPANNAAADDSLPTPPSRTTRSSARLRSSRK